MQDSRHWAVFLSDKTGKLIAQVYDVNAPDNPTVVPAAASTGMFNLVYKSARRGTHSLVLDDHMFWSTWTFNASRDTVEVAELGINQPASTLHTYTIQLPSHSVVQELQISPDGEKIAWVLTSRAWPDVYHIGGSQPGNFVYHGTGSAETVAAAQKALEKEIAEIATAYEKFYREGPQTESLWVSNLDGSNMKCLGETTFQWHSGPLPWRGFAYRLRWIPGGRLSFHYDRSLYTLPIE